jgi:hypothetical protein
MERSIDVLFCNLNILVSIPTENPESRETHSRKIEIIVKDIIHVAADDEGITVQQQDMIVFREIECPKLGISEPAKWIQSVNARREEERQTHRRSSGVSFGPYTLSTSTNFHPTISNLLLPSSSTTPGKTIATKSTVPHLSASRPPSSYIGDVQRDIECPRTEAGMVQLG